MTMIRAGGYLRVSDEEQLEGYSMDAQDRAFYDLCQQRGWESTATYCEEGRSALGRVHSEETCSTADVGGR